MGEKPAGGEEPTLELPKLFGRRKKKPPRSDDTSALPEETAPLAPPPEETAPPAPPPEPEPSATAPAAAPLPPAPEPQPEPTPVDAAPPIRETQDEAVPAPIGKEPAAEREPAPGNEATLDPAGSTATPPRRDRRTRPTRPARPARTRTRPRVPGSLAALLTGLVVGAAGCGLTYAALRGCEAVRGTSTCGGPGLFLLIAILALMVLLGAGLLTLMRIASAGSTSFLAVGLVAVLVMVALLDVVFSPWMFLVVPLMASAAYLLSHWVTTRFADEAADPAVYEDAPGPDVR